MDISEREKTRLPTKYQPCDENSNDFERSKRLEEFQECCKQKLWSYISPKISCTIPGYGALLNSTPTLNNCLDNESAINSQRQNIVAMMKFAANVSSGL